MTLKQYREQRGLTLQQVADAIGVSHVAVMKMEKCPNPRISVIRKLADVLGISVQQVIDAVSADVKK